MHPPRPDELPALVEALALRIEILEAQAHNTDIRLAELEAQLEETRCQAKK